MMILGNYNLKFSSNDNAVKFLVLTSSFCLLFKSQLSPKFKLIWIIMIEKYIKETGDI